MAIYPERPLDRSRDEAQKLQPGRLWRQLSPEKRAKAAEAFWKEDGAAAEQAEALTWIARQLNFRLKTIQKLPVERKIRYLASLGGVPEPVAIRALVAYHFENHRPMMSKFLDLAGVEHDNAVIRSENLQPPDPARLKEASEKLLAEYPREDVRLYFTTLAAQDPDTWGGLEGLAGSGED